MFVDNQYKKIKMKNLIFILCATIFFAIIFYPNLTNSNGNGSQEERLDPLETMEFHALHVIMQEMEMEQIFLPIFHQVDIFQDKHILLLLQYNKMDISKFGFELTSEDENGQKTGMFTVTNSVETKLTNNGSAVTHKGTGTSGQSNKTWSFDWTAPGFATSTGFVKFSGSFLAANGDFTNSGDIYHFDTTSYL